MKVQTNTFKAIAFLFVFSSASCASVPERPDDAAAIAEARIAYGEARYDDVVSLIGETCGPTNPIASTMIGGMHAGGVVGAKDIDRAVECYRYSAEGNHPEGQFLLAFATTFKGQDTGLTKPEAFEMFRIAADGGSRIAKIYHGTNLFVGAGQPRDTSLATRYFKEAATLPPTLGDAFFEGTLIGAAGRELDAILVGKLLVHMVRAGLPNEGSLDLHEDLMSADDWNKFHRWRIGREE